MNWPVAVFAWMMSGSAMAEDYPICEPEGDRLERTSYLRALSLDLRGTVPTVEEYEQVIADGEVSETWVDAWLASPEFAERVVRLHRGLLWNNVSESPLLDASARLRSTDDIYWRSQSADVYRGQVEYCGDFEASFDGDGQPIAMIDETGLAQEGYVWVSPYWDPDNPVKICAYDAQERLVSPSGVDCASADAEDDLYCGCGPQLQFCANSSEHYRVSESFSTDVDLRIKDNIVQDASYLELLTGQKGYVNGLIVDFLRYRTEKPANLRFNELPLDPDVLPDLTYADDAETWVEVDWGEQHSGIFTSPAFLMRFQTNRSRANRFYTNFLCQPFQPPDTGLTGLDNPTPTLDLTSREGCKGCHALLEPASAYWGRWTELGAGYLPSDAYPAFDAGCEACALAGSSCSDACDRFYVTEPLTSEQDPYIGWLNSYQFLESRHGEHVAEGPELLVSRGVADGRLPHCVAKTAAEHLLGRAIRDEEAAWLDGLSKGFVESGFRYRTLVRAIVQSENYRRVR